VGDDLAQLVAVDAGEVAVEEDDVVGVEVDLRGGFETADWSSTGPLLAFARCLRSHGFPKFPDPNRSGQLTHQMLAQAGIDLHEPALLQAADACTSVTHGVITKAAVARFVAGQ
jgi:hypothetical protein